VLALAVAFQLVQSVAWGDLEIIKVCHQVHIFKLANSSINHIKIIIRVFLGGRF
jgi:hypothetical protein